jgi:drug/metabolite transporter (DMT)-like permease
MKRSDLGRLVTLAAIWSLSFVFMRIVAPPLGPVWTAALRVLIGGAALVAWLGLTRQDANLRAHWRAFLVIGAVNSALPFFLFAYAALSLPASYLAILNATVPLYAVVLAAIWLDEPLTLAKLLGIVTGIAGVVLVTGAGAIEMDGKAWLAAGAVLAATLCYAVAAVGIKLRGQALSPYAIAAWSQIFAGLVLLPPATLFPPPGPFTPVVGASLAGLALLCSGVAYLLYFRLIRDIGPTRTATLTFLLPAFGIVWGVLLLGESVTLTMLAGAALIVAGTAAVLRPGATDRRADATR